jgi:two-component system OmpR family response regulator
VRILLAEDDEDLVAMLRRALGRLGHVLEVAPTGTEAVWMAGEFEYDVIVLDVNMPHPNGFEVCRSLRKAENWTPVMFLTARDAVLDRVEGLDAGADDYLAKPFSIDELAARLRAIARRQPAERPTLLRAGDFEIDPATRRARRGTVDLELTPKEFALLALLVRRQGEVVTRSVIVDGLYDFAFEARSNVVDALVRRLRDKVDHPFGQRSIETIRGVGYRLNA